MSANQTNALRDAVEDELAALYRLTAALRQHGSPLALAVVGTIEGVQKRLTAALEGKA